MTKSDARRGTAGDRAGDAADRWQGLSREAEDLYLTRDPGQGVIERALRRAYEAGARAMEARLIEALDGWADAAQYKGDFLRAKHGDDEDIERLRALPLPDPEAPDA